MPPKPPPEIQSLDYEEAEVDLMKERTRLDRSGLKHMRRRQAIMMFGTMCIIGVVIGFIAWGMTWLVGRIVYAKFAHVQHFTREGQHVTGWLVLLAYVVPLALVAASLTAWAPEAAGSGIPHVKAYLNGNHLPHILTFRALVAKMLGITCCVATGMPAGREGPMVHAGAILANGMARGFSNSNWLRCLPEFPQDFDNDFSRRSFVSMGAAAGVAAAFNAPIGGILFSLEEVSSFWDPYLTWTSFVCASIAAFVVNYLQYGVTGIFDDAGLVLFGHSTSADSTSAYQIWEMIPFLLLGAILGLMGAAFNAMNKRITILRKSIFKGRRQLRVLEAVLSISFVLTIFYWLPLAFPCRQVPELAGEHHFGGHGIHKVPHQCYSPYEWITPYPATQGYGDGHRRLAGGEAIEVPTANATFNDMATLLMQPQEGAILQLFSRNSHGYFSVPTLVVFLALYYFGSVFIYGIAVPSGLFIPGMIIGAATGRLFGEFIYSAVSDTVDPGIYALVGAAGMLGGVTRMTISLTVILVEVTNDINFLLPIMVTILVSKLVGDLFTESLYDIHIGLGRVPMLEPTQPDDFDNLKAKHIMAKPVVCLRERMPRGELLELLRTTHHHGFPLLDGGIFCGLITRKKLLAALDAHSERRAALPDAPDATTYSGEYAGELPSVPESPARRMSAARRLSEEQASVAQTSAMDARLVGGPSASDDEDSYEHAPPVVVVDAQSSPVGVEAEAAPAAASEAAPGGHAAAACDGVMPSVDATLGSPPKQRAKILPAPSHAATDDPSDPVLIDIRPFCDRAPFTVNELLPLPRALKLFRGMGLRHLVVLDARSRVAGMITRKDIVAAEHHTPTAYPSGVQLENASEVARRRMEDAQHRVDRIKAAAPMDRRMYTLSL